MTGPPNVAVRWCRAPCHLRPPLSCKFVLETCAISQQHGVTVLIGGVWEGPRVDGRYYQSSVLVGPVAVDAAVAGEVLATSHQRTVVDDRQVPGAFPSCATCPLGVIGILPDVDIDNATYVEQVMAVRASWFPLGLCVCHVLALLCAQFGAMLLLNPAGSHAFWDRDDDDDDGKLAEDGRMQCEPLLWCLVVEVW